MIFPSRGALGVLIPLVCFTVASAPALRSASAADEPAKRAKASDTAAESPSVEVVDSERAPDFDAAKDPAEASPPPAEPPPEPPPAPTAPGFVVERMPPSAYPEWQKRGIPGGSLRLTNMHGMQWPYYRKTGIGLGGEVWVDNSYQQIDRAERYPRTNYWVSQGRAVLRVTPTYNAGDFFLQGQVELVGNNNQTLQRVDAPDTDDLWLRFGRWNHWDIKVGRFQAYELFHFGMGLDINTVERQGALDEMSRQPVDFYYVTTMYYRPSGLGNVALHLNFNDRGKPAVRFEMLGQYGYDGLDRAGARPAVVVDFGVVKIKAGGEYRYSRQRDTEVETIMTPRVDANGMPVLDANGLQIIDLSYTHTRHEKVIERGAGGAVQLVLAPWVEAGVQGAIGLLDRDTRMGGVDLNASYTHWTVGGFANVSPVTDVVVGGGVHLADWTNLRVNTEGNFGHQTNLAAFAAVQYLVRQQLYVKLVGAYDRAKRENMEGGTTEVTSTMMSARLRLMYLF